MSTRKSTRSRGAVDRADWLLLTGLLLVGMALLLAFGWTALLAFAGVVLIVAGIALALAPWRT